MPELLSRETGANVRDEITVAMDGRYQLDNRRQADTRAGERRGRSSSCLAVHSVDFGGGIQHLLRV